MAKEQPRGAIPHLRSGAVAERSNPTSKERRLCRRRRAERSYSTFEVGRGDLVQGKEQWRHFAGAAVKIPHFQGKRNPSMKVSVARGHQRADTLKP